MASTSTNSTSVSDYGTPEDIKLKIRQNVYETEVKDATKNPLWQFFNPETGNGVFSTFSGNGG